MIAVAAAAGNFVDYPGFLHPGARIEAVLDRGIIAELIVKCPQGSGIVSYSKAEKVFCTPHGGCTPSIKKAIARTCG
ncbi:MAG: hypothetical protein ACT4N2_07700 [Hyphomicrobium sp.]